MGRPKPYNGQSLPVINAGSSKQGRSFAARNADLAPGKYTVGNVAFFTTTDTVVYVAGSTCPDGSPTPPDVSKCTVDGLDQWAKAAPHNASVRFSGQTAVRITETQ
ncbi:hypothetical protein GCM10023178_48970 [Actinomadura luteofluorescens]